jgi:tRNA G46 methylase TrmB
MLALEIGFGNGGFLIDQATTHPNQNFVGIDTSWPSVERLLHKLNPTQLGNIRVLHRDAATIVERLFAPATIQNVWINFPDPWPKKRHQSPRLIQSPFIDQLTIATDHAHYANPLCVQNTQYPLSRTPQTEPLPNTNAKHDQKANPFTTSSGKSTDSKCRPKQRKEPLPSI